MIDTFFSVLTKDTIAYAIIMLVLGLAGRFVLLSRKLSGDQEVARISADEALQRHNHEISIQLLEQLRKELARAVDLNVRLAPYAERARLLAHHLDCVLSAEDEHTRELAERLALQYLDSIRDATY